MNFKIDLNALLSHTNPPMRQRRQRTNFNDETIEALDVFFAKNPYPDINDREAIAKELKTNEDRIQVWFQNKRARYRKKMNKTNEPVSKKVSNRKTKAEDIEASKVNMGAYKEYNSTPVSTEQKQIHQYY